MILSRIAESFSRSRMDDMYVSESSTDDDEEEEVAERRQVENEKRTSTLANNESNVLGNE